MAESSLLEAAAIYSGHLKGSAAAYHRLAEALRARLAACRAIRAETRQQSKRRPAKGDPPSFWWASGHVGQQGNSADPWHPPKVDQNGHTIAIWDPQTHQYKPVPPGYVAPQGGG